GGAERVQQRPEGGAPRPLAGRRQAGEEDPDGDDRQRQARGRREALAGRERDERRDRPLRRRDRRHDADEVEAEGAVLEEEADDVADSRDREPAGGTAVERSGSSRRDDRGRDDDEADEH